MIEIHGYAVRWDVETFPMSNVRAGEPERVVFERGSVHIDRRVPLLAHHHEGAVIGEVVDWADTPVGLRIAAECWDPSVRRRIEQFGDVPLSVGLASGATLSILERRHTSRGEVGVVGAALAIEVSIVGVSACPGAFVETWRPL